MVTSAARRLTKPLTRLSPRGLVRGDAFSGGELHDGISLDFMRNRFYVKPPGRPALEAANIAQLFTLTTPGGTYVRGSNGLLYSPAANTPRIEFNANGECLGALFEATRQNLLIKSSQREDVAWSVSNVSITPNAAVAPDGSLTADSMVLINGNVTHTNYQSVTKAASSLVYVYSVFVKAGSAPPFQRLYITSDLGTINGVEARFDLTNGTVQGTTTTGAGWTLGTAAIIAYPNGWYRLILTGTSDALTVVTAYNYAYNGTVNTINQDGSNYLLWGAQLEQASFASSYIDTNASPVTRNGDVCIRTPGAEFNFAVGTLFAEMDTQIASIGAVRMPIACGGGGGAAGGLWMQDPATSNIQDGTNSANTLNVMTPNVMSKLAASYDATGMSAVLNGGALAIAGAFDGSIGPGNVAIGGSTLTGGSNQIWGHMRRVETYLNRVPDSYLQLMTV